MAYEYIHSLSSSSIRTETLSAKDIKTDAFSVDKLKGLLDSTVVTANQIEFKRPLTNQVEIAAPRMYAAFVDNSPDSLVNRKWIDDHVLRNLTGSDGQQVDVTAYELSQVSNINNTEISTSTWVNLGKIDQPLSQTSNVAFNTVKITAVPAADSAVNKAYVDSGLASKLNTVDAYTRSGIDTMLATKLAVADFNTFQTSNATTLNTKANSTDVYTKTQNDALLSNRLAVADFTSFQATNTASINLKANISETYSRTYLDSSLQSKLDVSAFNNFQASNTTAIGSKADKTYVDSLIPTAGTGLTKSVNVFSVNASQPQITSLGTLSTLSVTGASTLSGDISSNGYLVTRAIQNPLNADENFISGLRIIQTNNVNYIQSHNARTSGNWADVLFTSFGGSPERFGIYTDNVRVSLTTAATSAATGSLQVRGGAGIAGSLHTGGGLVNTQTHAPATMTDVLSTRFDANWNMRLVQNYAGAGDIHYRWYNTFITGGVAIERLWLTVRNDTTTLGHPFVNVSNNLSVTGAATFAGTATVSGTLTANAGISTSSIGAGVSPNTTYKLHLLAPNTAHNSLLRLAVPNLGTTSEVRSRMVYGCDGFGINDISSSIDFVRVNSAANGQVAISFRTSTEGTLNTDYSVERVRIQPDGLVSMFNGLSVTGVSTFLSSVVIPTPTATNHAATKGYVDTAVASQPIPVSTFSPNGRQGGVDFTNTIENSGQYFKAGRFVSVTTKHVCQGANYSGIPPGEYTIDLPFTPRLSSVTGNGSFGSKLVITAGSKIAQLKMVANDGTQTRFLPDATTLIECVYFTDE